MCSYITCVLGNWNRIIVLNVEATVGSAHGVWGYSVVRRLMKVVNASGMSDNECRVEQTQTVDKLTHLTITV